MVHAARYLFDLDFSAPPEPIIEEEVEVAPPEPTITVAEHERLLAKAEKKAFEKGKKEAMDNREQLAIEKSTALQGQLIEEISMIYTEVGHLMKRIERDASKLSLAFASQFASRLVAREPEVEVMGLLNQLLAPLRQIPHITIRLNEEIADKVRAIVDQQMQELGFEGTLNILPDPAIMPGDCEVEWADGGISRNLKAAIHQAEELLDEHFGAVPNDEEDEIEEIEEPDTQMELDLAPSSSDPQATPLPLAEHKITEQASAIDESIQSNEDNKDDQA